MILLDIFCFENSTTEKYFNKLKFNLHALFVVLIGLLFIQVLSYNKGQSFNNFRYSMSQESKPSIYGLGIFLLIALINRQTNEIHFRECIYCETKKQVCIYY